MQALYQLSYSPLTCDVIRRFPRRHRSLYTFPGLLPESPRRPPPRRRRPAPRPKTRRARAASEGGGDRREVTSSARPDWRAAPGAGAAEEDGAEQGHPDQLAELDHGDQHAAAVRRVRRVDLAERAAEQRAVRAAGRQAAHGRAPVRRRGRSVGAVAQQQPEEQVRPGRGGQRQRRQRPVQPSGQPLPVQAGEAEADRDRGGEQPGPQRAVAEPGLLVQGEREQEARRRPP